MTTITDTAADRLAAEAEKRTTYTAGLRALADLLDQHPDLADDVRATNTKLLVPVSHRSDARGRMAAFIRASKAAGHTVTKVYEDQFGNVDIAVAGVTLQVYAARELVCDRIVTGTREVTKEVPDPAALAAVPTVTVTETVEDVEWKCAPLLAAAESVSS